MFTGTKAKKTERIPGPEEVILRPVAVLQAGRRGPGPTGAGTGERRKNNRHSPMGKTLNKRREKNGRLSLIRLKKKRKEKPARRPFLGMEQEKRERTCLSSDGGGNPLTKEVSRLMLSEKKRLVGSYT